VSEFAATATLQPPAYDLLVTGRCARCLNQPSPPSKVAQAARLEPSAHVYSQIGMVYAKRSRWAEAMERWSAQAIDANYVTTHIYGGPPLDGNAAAAIEEYCRALAIDGGTSRRGRGSRWPRSGCGRRGRGMALRIGINAST
jgi:hypothetical protein